MSYLGSGVYPYTIYDLNETKNLAAQFKDLGYTTTAMHPNHGTNWNRENVYSGFGFDQFLTIEDFQNADKLRGMVTDAATYDAILEMLKTNNGPQFIFDVTMQNHSGYDTGLLPADKQLNSPLTARATPRSTSTCRSSRNPTAHSSSSLVSCASSTVLLWWCSLAITSRSSPDKYNNRWFLNEEKADHNMRLWTTDYLIWANYDVAGNGQESADIDLSTELPGHRDDEPHRSPAHRLSEGPAGPAPGAAGDQHHRLPRPAGSVYLASVKSDTNASADPAMPASSLQQAPRGAHAVRADSIPRAVWRRQGRLHQATSERRERDRPPTLPRARPRSSSKGAVDKKPYRSNGPVWRSTCAPRRREPPWRNAHAQCTSTRCRHHKRLAENDSRRAFFFEGCREAFGRPKGAAHIQHVGSTSSYRPRPPCRTIYRPRIAGRTKPRDGEPRAQISYRSRAE